MEAASDLVLTDEQIRSFREDGYLSVPAITFPAEVEMLRGILDHLFATKAGFKEGAQYDLVGSEEGTGVGAAKLPQIINPVNYASKLRHTQFRKNALSLARQLIGPQAGPAFEHAILKPPRHGAATPWHQDEAHRFDDNFEYNQISIWMPLQEATEANGCMRYVPGSNKGEILEHRSPGNDPKVHALECCGDFDRESAVPCPLLAGGAVMHSGRTLHMAGRNTTDSPRYAYILAFETPPKPIQQTRPFTWNAAKQTVTAERKRAWRRRGGVFIEVARKLRGGMLTNPRRVLFEARRLARVLLGRRRPVPGISSATVDNHAT